MLDSSDTALTPCYPECLMGTEQTKDGKDFSPLSHSHKQNLHPDSNNLLPFCRKQEHFSTVDGKRPKISFKKILSYFGRSAFYKNTNGCRAGLLEKDCTK